jgi:hypothetical protein
MGLDKEKDKNIGIITITLKVYFMMIKNKMEFK